MRSLTMWGLLLMTTVSAEARDYDFDGSISREVLENYLSRSITMMDLLSGVGDEDDNIRMLKNMGAKFAGRALYVWGSESRVPRTVQRRCVSGRSGRSGPHGGSRRKFPVFS